MFVRHTVGQLDDVNSSHLAVNQTINSTDFALVSNGLMDE